jgi:alcohol dehydrogenase class IV
MFPAPHGAVCAALLPHVMAANLRALERIGAGNSPGGSQRSRERYDEVARLVTGNAAATADDGVRWVTELVRELHLPSLRAYGLRSAQVLELVTHAAKASSMKANPVSLAAEELASILQAAL